MSNLNNIVDWNVREKMPMRTTYKSLLVGPFVGCYKPLAIAPTRVWEELAQESYSAKRIFDVVTKNTIPAMYVTCPKSGGGGGGGGGGGALAPFLHLCS